MSEFPSDQEPVDPEQFPEVILPDRTPDSSREAKQGSTEKSDQDAAAKKEEPEKKERKPIRFKKRSEAIPLEAPTPSRPRRRRSSSGDFLADDESVSEFRNKFAKPVIVIIGILWCVGIGYLFKLGWDKNKPETTASNQTIATSENVEPKDDAPGPAIATDVYTKLKDQLQQADDLLSNSHHRDSLNQGALLKLEALIDWNVLDFMRKRQDMAMNNELVRATRRYIGNQDQAINSRAQMGLMFLQINEYLKSPDREFWPEVTGRFDELLAYEANTPGNSENYLRIANAISQRGLEYESQQLYKLIHNRFSGSADDELAAIGGQAAGLIRLSADVHEIAASTTTPDTGTEDSIVATDSIAEPVKEPTVETVGDETADVATVGFDSNPEIGDDVEIAGKTTMPEEDSPSLNPGEVAQLSRPDAAAATIDQPETDQLVIDQTTNDQSEAVQPEIVQPAIDRPGIDQPEIAQTEIEPTEIEPTESARPEIGPSEIEQPEITQPEIDQFANDQTAVDQSEIMQTEITQSEIDQPEVAQTEIEPTEIEPTEVDQLENDQTAVDQSEIAQPEIEPTEIEPTQSEVDPTAIDRPEIAQSEIEQPEVDEAQPSAESEESPFTEPENVQSDAVVRDSSESTDREEALPDLDPIESEIDVVTIEDQGETVIVPTESAPNEVEQETAATELEPAIEISLAPIAPATEPEEPTADTSQLSNELETEEVAVDRESSESAALKNSPTEPETQVEDFLAARDSDTPANNTVVIDEISNNETAGKSETQAEPNLEVEAEISIDEPVLDSDSLKEEPVQEEPVQEESVQEASPGEPTVDLEQDPNSFRDPVESAPAAPRGQAQTRNVRPENSEIANEKYQEYLNRVRDEINSNNVSTATLNAAIEFADYLIESNSIAAAGSLLSQVSNAVYLVQDASARGQVRDKYYSSKKRADYFGKTFNYKGLYDLDGNEFQVDESSRTLKLVVFWSIKSQISTGLIGQIERLKGEFKSRRVQVIAVCDVASPEAMTELKQFANENKSINFYQLKTQDRASRMFVERFPVRKYPYLLMLSADNKVAGINVDPVFFDPVGR